MNNRKPKNRRGSLSRAEWAQFAPQPKEIKFYVGEGDNKELIVMANPRYPGIRRIIHKTMTKGTI